MTKKRPKPNLMEHRMVKSIDHLAAFEEFEGAILPKLREALRVGKTAEEIYGMATAVMAARAVSIAVTEPDSQKALAAIREVLDRTKGKATERKEIEHKYSKLSDDELDALLVSEEEALTDDSAPH